MGSTAIFYLISYTIQGIIAMIPYMIGISMIIVNTKNTGTAGEDTFSTVGILMLVMFMLYIILAYFLGNLVMIGHGMIYYSCIEQNENKSLHNEIDLIGTDLE
jgi:hypothetical protein